MRAAQNPVDHLTDLVAALPAELLNGLPGWLRAGVVVVMVLLIVARFCVPPLLRAIDDHRLSNTARTHISRSEDWVEVLRIRNTPRRWIGLQPPADKPRGPSGGFGPAPPDVPEHPGGQPTGGAAVTAGANAQTTPELAATPGCLGRPGHR